MLHETSFGGVGLEFRVLRSVGGLRVAKDLLKRRGISAQAHIEGL